MYREADVSAIEAAWTARDRKALADIGARLGIALAPESLAALVRRAETGGVNQRIKRRDVIATLLEAATYEDGIALFTWDRWLCLAVRSGDRVVAAVAPGEKPSKIWPVLKPWQRDTSQNRPRADTWAFEEAEDRVVFARVEVAAAAPLPDDSDLMRQILENPDDPAPREVLTDLWLSRDDVRGKLAKLDAEMAKLPHDSPDHLKREVVRASVVKQHGARIAGEVAEIASVYTLHAGFVDSVTMTAAAFRDHGARLFAQQPIRRLVLRPVNSQTLATLAKGPIGMLRELELAPGRPIDEEAMFAELKAPRLRVIDSHAHLHATTLRGLARNRALCDALEELVIRPSLAADVRVPHEEKIVDEVFERLALPRLRRLCARCWYITEERVAALRRSAPRLTEVELLTRA